MAVRTREELLETIRSIVGDTPDDNGVAIIEDITDTYNDLESRNDSAEWERRYNENDAEWRRRYTERFFGAAPAAEPAAQPAEEPEPEPPKTFEDLFTRVTD